MMDFLPEDMFEKTDIAPVAAQEIVVHDAAAEAVKEMAAAMSGQISALAEMLRVTNERMAEMEKTIRTLEKVTPQQGLNINRAIRERAAEICQEYRMGVTVTPVEQKRYVWEGEMDLPAAHVRLRKITLTVTPLEITLPPWGRPL